MEFGAHVSAAGGVDLGLKRALDFEMTACQIFTKNERQWLAKPLDSEVVARYHGIHEEGGLKFVVAHDSYLINIATPDDALWEKSRLALLHELERCDELAIPYLVSHPGAHVGSGTDAGIARVSEAIRRIHDERPDLRAMILIETTAGQGTSLGSSFEEIAEMISAVEDKSRIGVCLDTCHVFAAGYELREPDGYERTIASFETAIGLGYLKCLHINDSQKGLGSRVDRHAHIGEGEIGDAGFALLLNDTRLAHLPGILETPKGNDAAEDRVNLARLKGLIASADTGNRSN